MFAAYVAVTLLTAAANGSAAVMNFIGHEFVHVQADRNRVPRSWSPVLGTLLAAGALGLLAGFAVPVLGTLAAAGLVLYFVGAVIAHLRARNYDFRYLAVYLALAVASLTLHLTR